MKATRLALAWRHISCEDLGTFASFLAEAGFAVRYLDVTSEDLTSPFWREQSLSADLLIVLGGPMGVYEQDTYPFITAELELLTERLRADKPTLGLCLGAQLIAEALGGHVYASGKKEIGWGPLTLTAAAQAHPIRHLASGPTAVLHWHGDTFSLPPGATWLASTEMFAHQAFAWGKNVLALQFHPEVTAKGLEAWFVAHAAEIENTPGVSVQSLREQTERCAPAVFAPAQRFFHEWLESVSG